MVQASVIGCGNMGSALVRGLAESGGHTIVACDIDDDALNDIAALCTTTTTDPAGATDSDVIFLAVKPDLAPQVLADIDLGPDQTLVSIAAGVSTDQLEPHTAATVVRIMPNLAAETREMAAAVTGEQIPPEVTELLDDVGEFVAVEESRMDVATAVNGSGPAFVFYLIQAMRDAGTRHGLDPEDAEVLAAQTFKGAAETVLQSEASIEEVIDAVCSPKGTTIEGMRELRNSDVQDVIADAVAAAERRSKELATDSNDE